MLLSITLIAFAQAYYIIIEKTVPEDPDVQSQFQTIWQSFFLVFIMMLGEFADTLAYFELVGITPYVAPRAPPTATWHGQRAGFAVWS